MNFTGWLFDLYEDAVDGLAVWLLGDDGQRRRLRQSFPVTFYASGREERLKGLQEFIAQRFPLAKTARDERMDVFARRMVPVLAIQSPRPADVTPLFRAAERAFSDLTFADVDLQLSIRYAAQTGLFPLARCSVETDASGHIRAAEALSSPWDAEQAPLPLRVLSLEAEFERSSNEPRALLACLEGQTQRLGAQSPRALLSGLRALLLRHDPDLILAARGDTWLMPWLLALSEQWGIDLPLNRDRHGVIGRRKERWYFSYGQLVYRGEQVLLSGRWHIDRHNAMLWDDYDLEGVMELARVTCLPVQTAARVSPGTGISSVQMLTALRLGVLVPWQKQQAEEMRPALDLFSADQGGLVYQPHVGLHRNVGGLDFISMYPAIMVYCNISPETVSSEPRPGAERVPELNLWIDRTTPGLVPQALLPLLFRRVSLKERLGTLPRTSPQYAVDKKRASALKWLLVTCFGYLGYRNARFGRIEAHQAVTAYGREALLSAKEVVEELGYEVIQMYVDGLWVKGASCDFEAVLDEIFRRSGLPVALDGVYRWVAFLPSRVHPRRAAANRYFGVFQSGEVKVRGIATRRKDTPPWISTVQMEVIEHLAQFPQPEQAIPAVIDCVRRRLYDLGGRRVALEQLLLSQRISRELDDYRTLPPAARAAAQLRDAGRPVKPGQRVRFLFTRGEPGVFAWDLPVRPRVETLDVPRYQELLLRSVEEVLAPFLNRQAIVALLWEARQEKLPGTQPEPGRRLRGKPALLKSSVVVLPGPELEFLDKSVYFVPN